MTVGITELPPEGMQLGGVALAGDADRGTKTTEGLSLLFTTAGITVQGPQPQIERLLVWSGLDSATCREKIALDGGRSAAVMELTSGGQSIRFLLPTETVTPGQAAYLDQALPAWLARYKGSSGPSSTPPPPPPVSQTAASGATAPAAAVAGATAGAVAAGAVAAGANGISATQTAPAPTGPAPYAAAPPPPPTPVAATAPAPPGAPAAPGSEFATTGSPASSFLAPTSEPTLAPPPPPPPGSAPPPPPGMAPAAPGMSPPPPGMAPPAPGTSPVAGPGSPPPPPPPPTETLQGAPVTDPGAPAAPTGWEGMTDPAAAATAAAAAAGTGWSEAAWNDQALAQPPVGDVAPPPKKSRGWRKGRQAAEAPPEVGGMASPQAPVGPPTQPVLLAPGTLPPPPAGYQAPGAAQDPMVWSPPVDPVTGEAVWDSTTPGTDFVAPGESEPKKSRGWRRGKKAEAAAAAGAAGAVGTAAFFGDPGAAGATAPAPPDAGAQPWAPDAAQPWAPDAVGTAGAPQPWTATPGAAEGDPYGAALPPYSPEGAGAPLGTDEPGGKKGGGNRTTLIVLAVLLLVVVAGGVIYLLTKNNNTTTTTPPPSAITSPSAADVALAGSINLRLTDLPAGWARATTVTTPRPPTAPPAAQLRAEQALATCLTQPLAVVSGLFGSSGLPGQAAAVTSPVFEDGLNPQIQMYSTTSVLGSAAQVQTLDASFTNPHFLTCYGQYQSALVSGAIPGAVASVQPVTLSAPAGVASYGYVTTFTSTQGSEVVGDGFILGGRTVTRLVPSTNGTPIPATAFAPAYNAVVARVAQAAR